ncbi:fumarylacetoacetate hydrolase family protein [Shimia sp. CNT1-13L.2]|uniref:fumarylacetoacetate hydrolase family protein n=1 Tax=Shimia sp. CNT1-13L.2 TaxID=2959663 RepID=UPI0020CC48C6|nr:fumarylacetoacetate hydrolase family protein [Shimia sp. CNT1-13L.2]MCP9482850.1 fumarylacetoacetate hydrolase family protein [Shimia sp. CNT1-13L.2]
MSKTVIPAPAPTLLPVHGSDALFPVRRIFCVGRNYSEHAREMGHDPDREPPFFFTKPGDAAVPSGLTLPFPPATENLHHEAELVVAIGTGGRDIAAKDADRHIWGYATGNDLTRRDMQARAKEMRRPWDMAKGFDASAIIGPLHPITETGPLTSGAITAHVDDDLRQTGDLSEMIWPTSDVIAFLSRLVTLAPGDLIMTGTPAGVGPITPGQTCRVEIAGLSPATVIFKP